MKDRSKLLRKLASLYRAFAELAEDPMVWESRLNTAQELEAEAERLEAATRRGRNSARQSEASAGGERARDRVAVLH